MGISQQEAAQDLAPACQHLRASRGPGVLMVRDRLLSVTSRVDLTYTDYCHEWFFLPLHLCG